MLLQFVLLLYFAAVLDVSGLAKIEDPQQFAAIMRRHRLLPAWSIGMVARVFPWAEVLLASMLLTGDDAIHRLAAQVAQDRIEGDAVAVDVRNDPNLQN